MTAPAPRQSNWPEPSLFAATAVLTALGWVTALLAIRWVLT